MYFLYRIVGTIFWKPNILHDVLDSKMTGTALNRETTLLIRRFNSANCIRNIIATVGLQRLCLEPFGSFISFHYEHFSAQGNIHRKCANVTVIYQIKPDLSTFLKEFLLREESFNLAGRSFQIVGPETLNDLGPNGQLIGHHSWSILNPTHYI